MIDFDPELEPPPVWVVTANGTRLHLQGDRPRSMLCSSDLTRPATREECETLPRCRRCCLLGRCDPGIGTPTVERHLRAFEAAAVALPLDTTEATR